MTEDKSFPEIPDGLPEDFVGASGENPFANNDEEFRKKEAAYAKFREACMDKKTGCLGNYCDIMDEFNREVYVKRCARCRDSAQCYMVTQLRLMSQFYKKDGDEWKR
ncbi:MAG: hypothetical protein GF375_04350 [Candidatus Omnitrophica bacterium]|nr:hypothetical protein [Candidatus Omnitrophota bacterium]